MSDAILRNSKLSTVCDRRTSMSLRATDAQRQHQETRDVRDAHCGEEKEDWRMAEVEDGEECVVGAVLG